MDNQNKISLAYTNNTTLNDDNNLTMFRRIKKSLQFKVVNMSPSWFMVKLSITFDIIYVDVDISVFV